MYYPVDWYNQAGNGLTFGPKPESDYIFNFVGPHYPLPDKVCEGAEEGDAIECSHCRIQGCANYVYTNYTFIPGKATIPAGSPLTTLQRIGGVIDNKPVVQSRTLGVQSVPP